MTPEQYADMRGRCASVIYDPTGTLAGFWLLAWGFQVDPPLEVRRGIDMTAARWGRARMVHEPQPYSRPGARFQIGLQWSPLGPVEQSHSLSLPRSAVFALILLLAKVA